ncbi:MAG: hypothetical protein HY860_06705 [Chlamydiales bacterium]|nr:hypothetical protein [Chlamydiales bacterium]
MFLTTFFIVVILSSIVHGSIKYGISPMPTSYRLGKTICSLFEEDYQGTIYELGCGFGSMNIMLAKRCKQATIIAYEASFFPYICSIILKRIFQCHNLSIHYRNFLHDPLDSNSILFCYLSVRNMQYLEQKLKQEKFQGKIISHTFALPGIKQSSKTVFNDLYHTPIYIYYTN